MVEAARTTASPGGIWAIVIVAVTLLAFWLTAIMLADRSQVRASGQQVPGESGSPGPGSWAGGSVPGAQAPEIPGEAEHEPIVTPGRHSMPRQRTGESDRAEHSYPGRSHAGPGTAEGEEAGR
jgi:hypothetical protein